MTLPQGLRPPRTREQRKQSLNRIAREAEQERRSFAGRGVNLTGLGRRPGLVLAMLLGLLALGGALVTASRQASKTAGLSRRIETTMRELAILAGSLELYRIHVGHYPTLQETGLSALFINPGTTNWQGPYIRTLVNDPWNSPYRYDPSTTPPTLFSHGPDRRLGTSDDIHATPADFAIGLEWAAEWERPEWQMPPSIQILIPSNETPSQENQ